jgi:hypothetical protein
MGINEDLCSILIRENKKNEERVPSGTYLGCALDVPIRL